MIEEALEARLEEIVEYAYKHKLSYEVAIKIWKWAEKRPE